MQIANNLCPVLMNVTVKTDFKIRLSKTFQKGIIFYLFVASDRVVPNGNP